jgi:hypothetical protein
LSSLERKEKRNRRPVHGLIVENLIGSRDFGFELQECFGELEVKLGDYCGGI